MTKDIDKIREYMISSMCIDEDVLNELINQTDDNGQEFYKATENTFGYNLYLLHAEGRNLKEILSKIFGLNKFHEWFNKNIE